MVKVLVTGSNGLLGQTLVALLLKTPQHYEVFGISKGANRSERSDFKYTAVDITNEQELRSVVLTLQPHVIVHTAAMTNVDTCEDDKAGCDALNVDAVRYLVTLSNELKAHFIHLSADFIFDGVQGYYKEDDTPNPLSYYGASKLRSEQIVQEANPNFAILRTILVYGKVPGMSRNNIVLWVKEMLEQKKDITIVDDQYRMPTYVEELALACKLAIDQKAKGIYHVSSNELLSVFDITKQIAAAFHLDAHYIKPIATSTLNQTAPRPAKTGFDLTKIARDLGFKTRPFKEDLQRFKESLS